MLDWQTKSEQQKDSKTDKKDDEFWHESINRIRTKTTEYIQSSKNYSNIDELINNLVNHIPNYYSSNIDRHQVICNNIKMEALFSPQKKDQFWRLPQAYFTCWFDICINEKLTFKVGLTLLAWLWYYAQEKAKENPKKFVTIANLCELTDYHPQSVSKYLTALASKQIIPINQDGDKTRFLLNRMPWLDNKNRKIIPVWEDSLITGLGWNTNIDDLSVIKYIYAKQKKSPNPFITVTGEEFIIHFQILKMEMFISSVLSEKDLKKMMSINRNPRSIYYGTNRLKERLQMFPALLYRNKPTGLNAHYSQIFDVIPVLSYIGRREFKVDFDKLIHLIFYNKYRSDDARSRFIDMYTNFIKDPVFKNQAFSFLFECLESIDPSEYFKKNHKAKEIILLSLDMGVQLSTKNNLKIIGNGVICIKESDLELKNLSHLKRIAWGGELLFDYRNHVIQLKQLEFVNQHLINNKLLSITSIPSIIDNITHRITFKQYPIQNLSKSNRSVIVARDNFQFLMMDITQMELEIMKWVALKYLSDEDIVSFSNLSYDSMANAAGLPRKIMKQAFLMRFYGAGKTGIIEETGLSVNQYYEFDKYFKGLRSPAKLMNCIVANAKKSWLTMTTPLGYQIPLFSKSYRAISYIMQAIGAEILTRWILELHKIEMTSYIVNILHDEIVFEIPNKFNLYDTAYRIRDCLNNAAEKIIPPTKFNTKQSASSHWDKDDSAQIFLSPV